MAQQKNWMQRHPILTVIGIFFGITFLHSFFTGLREPEPSYRSQPRTTQAQPRNTADQQSPAYKLAALQAGTAPSSSLVSQFDSVLGQLSVKCSSDSKSRLGDYIYVGWEKLNGRLTLLETAQGINDSIPQGASGTLNCMEVAAAFVTLVAR